jgi:hypothetical protein
MPARRAANGFFFALWVAVCAAAPEFLWQGLFSLLGHFSLTDAAAALLIGAILAFFVEPVLERLRAIGTQHPEREPKTPAFAACEALSFAVVAVCVHEAITVYVAASHGNAQASQNLARAVSQALQWAAMPFFITIAWMAARGPAWLGWIVAAGAIIAGYLIDIAFGWEMRAVLTSVMPAIFILIAGRMIVREQWDVSTFSRCARATAVIALTWLVLTGLLQMVLAFVHAEALRIYEWSEFWSDVRFYIGWVTGLFVAPALVPDTPLPATGDAWRMRR